MQLWGFAINATRKNAVLISLNCETDFVAKSEDFKLFLGSTLKLLVEQGFGQSLRKGDADLEGFLKDTKYSAADSLEQATKLLIAKTKEKVEFTQIRGLRGSPS
jgi:translation elongation factor EF-Ts